MAKYLKSFNILAQVWIKVIGSYLIWAYLEDLLPLIENYLRFWVSNIQFLRFWLPWRNLPNRQTWFNPNGYRNYSV